MPHVDDLRAELEHAARMLRDAASAREDALRQLAGPEDAAFDAQVALVAAERDLRLAEAHLESVRAGLRAAGSLGEKSWGNH